jgi:LmbE family N-acetylglucosaminyl deacetylase
MTSVVLDVHADDGIYSVGEWIAARRDADVVVVTMLGAVPSGEDETWVKQLLADKDAACGRLGARVVNLPFLDGKYGRELYIRTLASAVRQVLREQQAREILVPLGLRHSDHLVTAPVALGEALATRARVMVYEDLPYRVMYPDEVRSRLDSLDPLPLEFAGGGGHLTEKREACRMFSNQFGEDADRCCFAPERIWVVRR